MTNSDLQNFTADKVKALSVASGRNIIFRVGISCNGLWYKVHEMHTSNGEALCSGDALDLYSEGTCSNIGRIKL